MCSRLQNAHPAIAANSMGEHDPIEGKLKGWPGCRLLSRGFWTLIAAQPSQHRPVVIDRTDWH